MRSEDPLHISIRIEATFDSNNRRHRTLIPNGTPIIARDTSTSILHIHILRIVSCIVWTIYFRAAQNFGAKQLFVAEYDRLESVVVPLLEHDLTECNAIDSIFRTEAKLGGSSSTTQSMLTNNRPNNADIYAEFSSETDSGQERVFGQSFNDVGLLFCGQEMGSTGLCTLIEVALLLVPLPPSSGSFLLNLGNHNDF